MLLPSSMIFFSFHYVLFWFDFFAHARPPIPIESWRRVFVCYACAHMVSSSLMLHVFAQKSTTHWICCKFLLELFLIDTHFTRSICMQNMRTTRRCATFVASFGSYAFDQYRCGAYYCAPYINVITLLPVCRFAIRALRRAEEKAVGTRSRFISLHLYLMPLYMGAAVFSCCCSFVTRTEASRKCHGYSIPLPVHLNKPMEGESPKTTSKRALNI